MQPFAEANALTEASRHLRTEITIPLIELRDAGARQVKELGTGGTPGLFGKTIPPLEALVRAAQGVIQERLSAKAQPVAARGAQVGIRHADEAEVSKGLDTSAVIPRRLTDALDGVTGGLDTLLAQLDAKAGELIISNPTPGREQRRLRTVVSVGNAASIFFKVVQHHPEGCVVRPLEHLDDAELFIVTECRYEPASELRELVDASEALDSVLEHTRDCLWTAVDHGEVVGSHRPEQRTDAERGLRLLTLGLVFGRLTRKGHTYRLNGTAHNHACGVDPSSVESGCIAKSFVAAVERLQTDLRLAEQVEEGVHATIEAPSWEAACKAIQTAAASHALVPTAHAPRVRFVLAEELRGLKRLLATGNGG